MLFSPSEKRASQLTQYYQLAVPDLATAKETDLVGSDIDSWFSRRQYAGLYSALEGKFTRWTSLFEGGLRDLVPLATIHPLLTRCMNAAADQSCHRRGVVRRAKRPPVGERSACQIACHRMNHRNFKQLTRVERGQNRGQPRRQHALASAGWPGHQDIMPH